MRSYHIAARRAARCVALLLLCSTGAARAAPSCDALNGLTLRLGSAAVVMQLSAKDMPAVAPLPAYCLVDTIVSSNGNPLQSLIESRYWLPDANWNGRFLGTGNGGFAGSVSMGPLSTGLQGGYATGNTDMGTGLIFKCNIEYCGSVAGQQSGSATPLGGLYGDTAAIQDFGYGATHLMTEAGKQIVRAFYGHPASHSYFHGCSTGGQQALMEAQRFPADYDGIIAGAPAYDRTHLHLASTSSYEVTHAQPDYYLTDEALALAHAALIKQCAGTDGGLASDDYLTQPARCGFDAAALACTGAVGEVPCTDQQGTSCTCLTPHQTVAMDGVWGGAQDDLGRTLYPGFERGAEEPVALEPPNYDGNHGTNWQEAGTEPAFDSLVYWAFGPAYAWTQLFASTQTPQGELASEIAQMDATPVGHSTFAGVLNAVSPNLSAFTARGGKLLIYQGYADPLIPTAGAIDYYNAVAKLDPVNVASYLRLFLAPGMWHCTGGPGANAFGNQTGNQPPLPGVASDDVQAAMVSWVETSAAPDKVIATRYVDDNRADGVAFQRPLCAYPANAKYRSAQGKSPLLASSYKCAAGRPVINQEFDQLYGP